MQALHEDRTVGSQNMVVRLTAYHERATVVWRAINHKQSKNCTNLMNKLPLRMHTSIFDDLYLKSNQKVVRL